MSLDDRIRSTVDQAVAPLVKELLKEAAAEQEEAIRAAKAFRLDPGPRRSASFPPATLPRPSPAMNAATMIVME